MHLSAPVARAGDFTCASSYSLGSLPPSPQSLPPPSPCASSLSLSLCVCVSVCVCPSPPTYCPSCARIPRRARLCARLSHCTLTVSTSLYAEHVVQRYATTGVWLLINVGTEGLKPNEHDKLREPEPEPAGRVHKTPVGEATDMHVGTSARELSAAGVLDRGRRRRRERRTGSTRKRQCPQCLSPMYSSHSCRTQQFAESWRVHYDNEPTFQPVATQQAWWYEQPLDTDRAAFTVQVEHGWSTAGGTQRA